MSSGRRYVLHLLHHHYVFTAVVITGGASGIGAEAARLFTEHGARVVITDVKDELGRNVAVSIGEDKVSYVHCDVRKETEVESAVKFAVEKHGRIDVIFSNAGVPEPLLDIRDLNLEAFDRVMAVNVRGAAAFIKHVARAMVEKKTRGSIVCTTSVASVIAGTVVPHGYTASKHALVGLIRSAAGDLGKHGIRVNGVAPFGVATPLVCEGYKIKMEASELEEIFSETANLKGIVLKARHVAEAALFLASDDSAYVSGHNLLVDGGFSVVKN
ncbi:short-chain dehydrogenase reductase 3b-like [Brassica rapa]|uniref:short-chain dehydrogenase reductase 3b-like n=1 Tax=Brassica campestris TaxID=3711 RepID=UPI00142E6352|nr:short-chain dehydrogenase reductase 3b-like [Brassica rapa]